MHGDTMVTTYTIMSTTHPHGGGTWSLTSKVRETLTSALEHVGAMERPARRTIPGGTWHRPSLRYTWEETASNGYRCHDMVIIVPDMIAHTGLCH